ncbi:hypothetical protein PRO82_000070 [Candidatus Protochlamydia amoebophila]|nr:hypothetical protein [Candidatus Protochlamydia amoebophila]
MRTLNSFNSEKASFLPVYFNQPFLKIDFSKFNFSLLR